MDQFLIFISCKTLGIHQNALLIQNPWGVNPDTGAAILDPTPLADA